MKEENIKIQTENNRIIEFLKGLGTIILYFVLTFLGGSIFGKFYNHSNKLVAGLSPEFYSWLFFKYIFCLDCI